MKHILCVGSAVLDTIFRVEAMPTRAEKYRAKDRIVTGGGIAANAAVTIQRLGGQAHLLSALGLDTVGRDIRIALHEEGVDCTFVREFTDCRSSTSAILIDAHGERLVVSYSDPTIPRSIEWLPQQLPSGIDAVLADTRWQAASKHLFELARQAHVPCLLDGDRMVDDPDLLHIATHIAFSVQGVRELTGEDNPVEALQRLERTRAPGTDTWYAVTAGADGVYFLENGVVANEPGFKVDVVDTLGAGDVWHGAFVLALCEGMKQRAAIRFASATAALKCTRFGGRDGAPKRAEVEGFLREHS
jgi:sulfofructose kinase